MPEPSHRPPPAQEKERGAALALLPIAATVAFYALPEPLQEQKPVQFAPQISAYLACALWAVRNVGVISRLGLERRKLLQGLRLGLLVGLALGSVNSLVILQSLPALGFDIIFLKQTPHAMLPVFVMVPWFICLIAFFVEFNFRGFLLGRLLTMGETLPGTMPLRFISFLAVGLSALVFAFDPFMTNTFRHLHWIAVWDGAAWGACWIATRNLYLTITAHAVEVIVMYSAVRSALM